GWSGEVEDGVGVLRGGEGLSQLAVADVAFDEDKSLFDVVEGRAVSGIGEQVEDDEMVIGVAVEPEADEVRADESGSAGDEDPHRRNLSGRTLGLCLVARRRVLWTKRRTFVAVSEPGC